MVFNEVNWKKETLLNVTFTNPHLEIRDGNNEFVLS